MLINFLILFRTWFNFHDEFFFLFLLPPIILYPLIEFASATVFFLFVYIVSMLFPWRTCLHPIRIQPTTRKCRELSCLYCFFKFWILDDAYFVSGSYAETFLFKLWSHCHFLCTWNFCGFHCYWRASVCISVLWIASVCWLKRSHFRHLILFFYWKVPWRRDVSHVQASIRRVSHVWLSYLSHWSCHCLVYIPGTFFCCFSVSFSVFLNSRYLPLHTTVYFFFAGTWIGCKFVCPGVWRISFKWCC